MVVLDYGDLPRVSLHPIGSPRLSVVDLRLRLKRLHFPFGRYSNLVDRVRICQPGSLDSHSWILPLHHLSHYLYRLLGLLDALGSLPRIRWFHLVLLNRTRSRSHPINAAPLEGH